MKYLKIWVLILTLIFLGRNFAMDRPLPIMRGINLGNALEAPFEGQWGVVIKDEYFKLIKDAGFDHVRIPIRWNAYADYKPPYTINPYIFERVDHVINEAFKNGLYVIINIHHYEEIMQEPEKHKERFLKLWEQIADHYKNYPESLYFELLNEPCFNLKSNLWNEYLKEAIKIIRKTNPTRKIIVGPTEWNNLYKLNELTIPLDDKT
jgi:endoglucanase